MSRGAASSYALAGNLDVQPPNAGVDDARGPSRHIDLPSAGSAGPATAGAFREPGKGRS